MEVYGGLSWATSGTTRGLRNRPSHVVLLRSTGGTKKYPRGGGAGVPQKGPLGRDLGGLARPGAGMAGFPGSGGGAPRRGRGGQRPAAPGPADRSRPLALPPQEPAAAAAPAPTQTEAQVTAEPKGDGLTPGRPSLGPQTGNTGGMGADRRPGAPPPAGPGTPILSTPSPAVRAAGHMGNRRKPLSWMPERPRAHGEGRRQMARAGGARRTDDPGKRVPLTRRPMTTDCWPGPPPPAPANARPPGQPRAGGGRRAAGQRAERPGCPPSPPRPRTA